MLLIREESWDTQALVEATQGGGKNYFIEGVWLQSELKNRNGRWYPKSILENEVNRYRKEMIESNRAVGELGHPPTPTINYDRASHKILSLTENGNNWIGRAKILSTPMGTVVKNLIDDDVKFGVSSRGLGSLKEDRQYGNVVQKDYHLATAGDIVSDPSAPDAFVNGIMEGKEWIWNGSIFQERDIAESKSIIEQAKSKQLEEVTLSIFQSMISKL
jgi:Prohead core protein serine protease